MLKLTRQLHWKDKLTDLINERRSMSFQWGTNDCCQWLADCVLAVTGHDFATASRGTYKTPLEAYKCLQSVYLVNNLKELMKSLFSEQHIAYARPGDIVFKNSNYEGFDAALGICYGARSFFLFDEDDGLLPLDTLQLDGSYRVA